MSASNCGCDPEAEWICQECADKTAARAYRERVAKVQNATFQDTFDAVTDRWEAEICKTPAIPLPDLSFGGAVTGTVGVQAAMAVEHEEEVVEGILTTEEWLRGEFPHGHKHYLPVALKQLELHSKKNHDYASGGDALGNFNRVAAILGNYPNLKLSDRRVVALVYALKQIDAVLWGINSNITQKVEGLDSRLDDIAVYATIVQCMNSEAK